MINRFPDRVVVQFAATFEPQIRYFRSLNEAAALAQDRLKVKHWGYGLENYILRDTEKRLFLAFNYSRIGYLCLGLSSWASNRSEYAKVVADAVKYLGIEKLSRIGFKTQAFLPLDMSFTELGELMFGSFVSDATKLRPICGEANDALVQLHGVYKGLKSQTVIAPHNAEQVILTFSAIPNLEQLIEPKLFDTGLKEFRDRVAIDCLLVDTDLSMENIAPMPSKTSRSGPSRPSLKSPMRQSLG